ncbi:MAG: hypothetical protein KL863_06690 [Rhizobium sp.]|nr:hypothetical protein [Rhizobium sp.]
MTASDSTGSNEGLFRRLARRAGHAVPSPSTVIFGSAGWGLLLAIAAMVGIWTHNRLIVANPYAIAAVYFYGGSLAFAPALWLARLVLDGRGSLARLAGASIIMAVTAHLVTAAVFALQYRVFYSHWHADFPQIVWFFQLAFTSAGAGYTFTVGSLAYYWPFSCLAFIGFGLWFARRGSAKAH